MILEVEHQLSYSYSDYVGLNPHYFFLSPKPTPYQYLIIHELGILPKPDLLNKNIDQEGNIQHVCFINQRLKTFEVSSKFSIKTDNFKGLNFVFFPFECAKIPFKYPQRMEKYVEFILNSKVISDQVREYALSVAEKANYSTIDFLMEVTTQIHKNFRYISRERGDAVSADETLKSRSGSCRDFSVFMMEVCASVGILARFVSGYLYGSELHQHDLHAWVEVLLPGGGWRGFDPTEGRVVDKNYIALAASIESAGLNPVRGTFRASGHIDSVLNTLVTIKETK
ncbi:MAG: transglutaminase family protein [Leadbetterella sp.]|jgi:transglutaminase-like putative cysteine protease|nr:transglutaminase family protein [Leadbetterella sp.]